MHRFYKRIIPLFFSFILMILSIPCSNVFVCAADGTSEKTVSNGITIFIMIILFIISAVLAGIISFRIKSRKIKNKDKNSSTDSDK